MATVTCLCPPKATGEVRHPDGDTIDLRERLDFRSALTARNVFVLLKTEDPDVSTGEIMATLTETYLLLGIESWSLVDAKGKAVEVSKAAIRELLLTNQEAAMVVGDEADARYSEAVIAPLVARASNSSPATPTNGSTSVTTGSVPKPRKPSKPSSTTTTRTGATVTTSQSPAGVSN
jgi:hypothetical protein